MAKDAKNQQPTTEQRGMEKELSEMVNAFLILLLCYLASIQQSRQRLAISLMFSLSCLVHFLESDNLTDLLYYLTAGMVDCVLIFIICFFARPTIFTDLMVLVCAGSLLLNVYGWIIYELFLAPISYDVAFSFLYLIVVFVFLKKDTHNDKNRVGGVLLPYRKCNDFHFSLFKKA